MGEGKLHESTCILGLILPFSLFRLLNLTLRCLYPSSRLQLRDIESQRHMCIHVFYFVYITNFLQYLNFHVTLINSQYFRCITQIQCNTIVMISLSTHKLSCSNRCFFFKFFFHIISASNVFSVFFTYLAR